MVLFGWGWGGFKGELGKPLNTTLRILSERGVPLYGFFFGKKGVTDFLQKGLKIVFFAQKTPDFGPKKG